MKFKIYTGIRGEAETATQYITRILAYLEGNTPIPTNEQKEWLESNIVNYRLETTKIDSYLIIDDEIDANAFRLKFNI